MKKRASKVTHNRPRPFYFTVQPRPQPTADSPELIFHIMKSRDQSSVLLSVNHTVETSYFWRNWNFSNKMCSPHKFVISTYIVRALCVRVSKVGADHNSLLNTIKIYKPSLSTLSNMDLQILHQLFLQTINFLYEFPYGFFKQSACFILLWF